MREHARAFEVALVLALRALEHVGIGRAREGEADRLLDRAGRLAVRAAVAEGAGGAAAWIVRAGHGEAEQPGVETEAEHQLPGLPGADVAQLAGRARSRSATLPATTP